MMQLEVILYLLGRLFNIPTNWYWYFNICFCSNAQFLTPRETLDSYRKKQSTKSVSNAPLLDVRICVVSMKSMSQLRQNLLSSFLRIRAPVKSSELRTSILQRQQDTNKSKHEIPAPAGDWRKVQNCGLITPN